MQNKRVIHKSQRVSKTLETYTALDTKRTVLLFGEIETKLIRLMIAKLMVFDSIGSEPIKMFINSPGGDVGAGLALIDIMESLTSKITTIITGESCSMASYISICGDTRYITKHGIWMMHPMSVWHDDYLGFVKDRVAYETKMQGMMDIILEENSGLTRKEIEDVKNHELWLDANQCLEKKIVDKIV